jgi:nucleoside-diphosphate-sugar epimerase
MSKQDLTKIKGQTPLSVIVHGGNHISFLLAKTLLEQGSHVVIIDKYTNNSKKYFSELKKSGKVSFIDFKGLKSFYEKIARIDYLYYMLGQKLEESDKIDSKNFLSETDYLNSSLSAANKYKAKISLVTSLKLNRDLSNIVNNQQEGGKSKPYTPLELQRYGENYAAEFVDKTKANLRIIRLGTIVGKGVSTIADGILDKLFKDATQKHQIEIEGEGLEIHNLIHESDAVYGILKLTFSNDTKGEVISLCNKNEYTTLSLAYKLLEIDVEAKAIKFVERGDNGSILQDLYVPAPNAIQFGWKQNISLEESTIDQARAYYESSDRKWSIDKTEKLKEKSKKEDISLTSKTKLGNFVSSVLKPFAKITKPKELFKEINYSKIIGGIALVVLSFSVLYFLIAPAIGVTLGSYLVYREGETLSESISNLDFNSIESSSDNISTNVNRVDRNLNRIYWFFNIVGLEDEYRNIDKIVQGTQYASESINYLNIALRPLGEYIKDYEPAIQLNQEDSSSRMEYSQYLQSMNDNAYLLQEGIYKMSLAESLITSVNMNNLPSFSKEYVFEYKDLITEINALVSPLEEITGFIPNALGLDTPQRYLILLQDDAEIRSTGGWIPSYALIVIDRGQISELYVDDIYSAQSVLSLGGNNYRTPSSMLRALNDTRYSFPLVNWSPNLDSVLLSSEQFIYDLGKGDTLDGILTIDITAIQRILSVWGGLEVPGETELIDSDNLYSKIFETKVIDPAQSRRSPFLTDFFDSFVTRLFSSNFNDYKAISQTLGQSLEEKHIQMTFKNSSIKAYADSRSWDGNIDTQFLTTPVNIDWNWGANKMNLYIKKNHTLTLDIKDKDTIEYTYQVAIENDAEKEEFPYGEYTNYIRIFLPYSARITGIKGLEDNRYDIYEEGGYKIAGGWFNIPIKTTKTFEIKYQISRADIRTDFFIKESDTRYELDIYIHKQPGSRKDAYNISILYPEDWSIENSDTLSRIENNLNRRFELSSDQNFYISWKK